MRAGFARGSPAFPLLLLALLGVAFFAFARTITGDGDRRTAAPRHRPAPTGTVAALALTAAPLMLGLAALLVLGLWIPAGLNATIAALGGGDRMTSRPSRAAVPGAVTTFQVASPDLEAVVRDLSGPAPGGHVRRPTATRPPCAWCGRTTPRARPGTSSPRHRSRTASTPRCPISRPAAFVEECEIYEQFGIRPATGKPLNRIMLPPHADLPTLGRKPGQEPEEVHAPHTVGGRGVRVPVRPGPPGRRRVPLLRPGHQR